MKILIIGKSGQLANELLVEKPQDYEVLALGRNDVDITNFKALDNIVAEYQPKHGFNKIISKSRIKPRSTNNTSVFRVVINNS